MADGTGESEAGAWELLKRRVAENRKLSTENRKLSTELREAHAQSADLQREARTAAHRQDLQLQSAAQKNEQLEAELVAARAICDQQQEEIQRRVDQGQQDKAELAEIESMVGGLAAEKQQMEETVHELMLRLQAATKHTQALADERTFLEDAQRRTLAEEEGSDHTQWYSGMDMRGAGGDDMWNFEQLQREKAMLTEEVARLAQIAEAARVEKARLARVVVDKSKKIAFLYEEKDMLLQHLREALDTCSQENEQLRSSLQQAERLGGMDRAEASSQQQETEAVLPSGGEADAVVTSVQVCVDATDPRADQTESHSAADHYIAAVEPAAVLSVASLPGEHAIVPQRDEAEPTPTLPAMETESATGSDAVPSWESTLPSEEQPLQHIESGAKSLATAVDAAMVQATALPVPASAEPSTAKEPSHHPTQEAGTLASTEDSESTVQDQPPAPAPPSNQTSHELMDALSSAMQSELDDSMEMPKLPAFATDKVKAIGNLVGNFGGLGGFLTS